MASLSTSLLALSLFLLLLHVDAKNVVVPEDGYTITTVLDGHKPHINPYTVVQRPGYSDLVVLDSTNSIFYTVQFPISQESVFTRFSGIGSTGYSDGDVSSAQFNKPRSFAFDIRGNMYVADRFNKVIRKISVNGVTTIAGGSSEKSTIKDGPAQNASFSEDFELTFIPGQCALLVSDHMRQLIHQINLKEEDCTLGSKSGLGAVMTWTLGLVLSCLLGIAIGIAVRPYIIPHKGSSPCHFIRTWKHYLTSLGKPVLMLFSGIKSAVAECSFSNIYAILMNHWNLSLSHLLLMFSLNTRPHLESVSLIDLDACNSGEIRKSSKYHDQLKDLMSFDDVPDSTKASLNRGYDEIRGRRVLCHGGDVMTHVNVVHQESSVCNLGIVKRR